MDRTDSVSFVSLRRHTRSQALPLVSPLRNPPRRSRSVMSGLNGGGNGVGAAAAAPNQLQGNDPNAGNINGPHVQVPGLPPQQPQQQPVLIPPPPPGPHPGQQPPPLQPLVLPMCQATQQQLFTLQPMLTILSPCPACTVLIAHHTNVIPQVQNVGAGVGLAPPAPAAMAAAAPVVREPDPMKIYSTLEGIAKSYPKWNVSKVPVVYLRSLEDRLLTSGVPETHWYKIMPMVIPDGDSHSATKKWITRNIVQPSLSWDEAKEQFIAKYKRTNQKQTLTKEFREMRQLATETVQEYSDRFLSLVDDLGVDHDLDLVIEQYKMSLQPKVIELMEQTIAMICTQHGGVEYEFGTLDEAIQCCQRLGYTITPKSKASGGDNHSNLNSNKRAKHCVHHPDSKSHDTKDCWKHKQQGGQAGAGKGAGGAAPKPNQNHGVKQEKKQPERDLSTVQCYNCKQFGHYSNTCRNKKVGEIGAGGKPISGKLVNMIDRTIPLDVISPFIETEHSVLLDISFSPSTCAKKVKFLETITVKTGIDTGAQKCFLDVDLAKQLEIPLQDGVPGSISLADNTVRPRYGVTKPVSVVASFSDGRPNIQFDYCFDLLPINSAHCDYHVLIGADMISTLFGGSIPTSYVVRRIQCVPERAPADTGVDSGVGTVADNLTLSVATLKVVATETLSDSGFTANHSKKVYLFVLKQ